MSVLTPSAGLIQGHVSNTTVGATNTIQLLNPTSSGKIIRVRELQVTQVSLATRMRVRRTSSPLNLTGTVINGRVHHRDPRIISVIAGLLRASSTTTEPLFTEAECFWFEQVQGTAVAYSRHGSDLPLSVVIRPGSFPVGLKPGSALEIQGTANTQMYANFVWDEG